MKKFLFLIIFCTTHSFADDCLAQFYQQTPPELVNQKLAQHTYPLCFHDFAVMYSGIAKTPLWVAEKLTPERLSAKIKREDNFHEEPRLPPEAQSFLSDYRGSGYDRGHMAPNGDMADKTSQYDSFSLANIIPQNPYHNQNTWREIEESTRAMVKKYRQTAYVVTGTAFLSDDIATIGNHILVPTHVFKAVYFPELGIASAWFTPNDESDTVEKISLCALQQRTGIQVFPSINAELRRQVYDLPTNDKMVKTHTLPMFLGDDYTGQCQDDLSQQQLQNTRQQFQQNLDVTTQDDDILPNSPQEHSQPSTEQQKAESSSWSFEKIFHVILQLLLKLFGK